MIKSTDYLANYAKVTPKAVRHKRSSFLLTGVVFRGVVVEYLFDRMISDSDFERFSGAVSMLVGALACGASDVELDHLLNLANTYCAPCNVSIQLRSDRAPSYLLH